MKILSKRIALAAAATGLMGATVAYMMFASHKADHEQPTPEEPVLQAAVEINAAHEVVVIDVAIPEKPVLKKKELPEEVITTAPDQIEFKADQILVTVNGVALLGSDIVPVSSANVGQPITMSPEMYVFRLSQAVNRELTFQEARKLGVELGEVELNKLKNIPKALIHDETVVDSLGDQAAEIQHEVLQAKAYILERILLERNGAPSPHVTTEQVEAYYEENIDRLGPLPDEDEARAAAWGALDVAIRKELEQSVRAEYQAQRESYIGQLRAAAQIESYLDVRVP